MRIELPRSTCRVATLGPLSRAALDALRIVSRDSGGVIALSPPELAQRIGEGQAVVTAIVATLTESRHLSAAEDGAVAVVSVVSAKLHAEKVANLKRRRAALLESWPVREMVAKRFPGLVSAKPKPAPANYNMPSAFRAILATYESHHLHNCPPDVERITEGYYPGELTALLTAIEEQASARREVVLLYTRKAAYVSVRRAPKR